MSVPFIKTRCPDNPELGLPWPPDHGVRSGDTGAYGSADKADSACFLLLDGPEELQQKIA